MDHTHARPVGLLAFPDDTALANLANEGAAVVKRLGHGYYFVFGPAREVQHRLGLLNGALRLVGLGSSSALAPADLELALQVGRLASNLAGSEGRLDDAATGAVFAFEGYPEEAPNRASRVGLSEQADELGQRKIRVEWQATEQTRQGLRRLLELLSRDAGRTGLGRVRVQLVEGTYDENAVFYNHAAGTTRMHADPRRGVTDADGRIHGTANLFVAGSSLFPTAGFVNPMMTILALALRLADHLNTSMERN
jgi:choline dehydrogenase-like flavoprotein